MSNIIQKIIDNKHKIIGIEIDGNFIMLIMYQ